MEAHLCCSTGGTGTIAGFGALGYEIAINAIAGMVKNEKVDAALTCKDDFQDSLRNLNPKDVNHLVTSLTNIYYLSGFTGSAGLLY